MTTRSRLIQLRMSDQVLRRIDEAAKRQASSRSGFIREAVMLRLNDQHVAANPTEEDILEFLRNNGG